MVRTEIFINNKRIDLYADLQMPFTYQIADIRNPQDRNDNFSKTITIPGSKINNALFEAIWDVNYNIQSTGTVNFNPDFNPNLKADVVAYVDGIEQFRGIAKMENIRVTHEWYKWEFDFTFLGKVVNIFSNIANNYLHQLDFDKYNHTLNKTNIQNSWSGSIIKNGSAYGNFSGGTPTGEGYVYPLIDYGLDPVGTWKTTSFFPGIYLKSYIDEIFSYAGFTYSSTELNTSFFKKLIVPFNSSQLKYGDAAIQLRQFQAERTSTQSFNSTGTVQSSPGTVIFQDETTSPNVDLGGVYDNTTGIHTVGATGYYDLSFRLKCQLRHQPTTSPATLNTQYANFFAIGELQKKVGANWVTQTNVSNQFNFTTLTVNAGDTSLFYLNLDFLNQSMLASDQFRVVVYNLFMVSSPTPGNPYGSPTAGNMFIDVLDDSIFKNRLTNTSILEGDTVEMNNALPRDIKMGDFLKSVIKLFNLYVSEDKNTPNKLIIETRDDFYAGGTTRDWTEKLDLSKPIEIRPMGELNFKQYLLSYKEDTDYYNEKYTKAYGEVYGEKKYEVTNDFIKDVKKLEVIFSPTPLVDQPPSDRVIPRIFQVDQQGNVKPKISNLRLLIFGGIKQNNPGYSWVASSGTTTENYYGYAGHLDDPKNPTRDVNFYYPRELYYTTANYTNDNLFNRYHKKTCDEITDVNSKILTAFFYITPLDILRLDFRDKFYFEHQYWRLNKIYDYNALISQTTKCEFLLIKDGIPFSSRITKLLGSPITTLDDTVGPSFNNPGSGDTPGDNSYNSSANSTQRVLGERNFVGFESLNVIVLGNDNRVGGGCRNVAIFNSSGITVFGGMDNVTVINSSGITVTERNEVWINNVRQGSANTGTKTVYTDYTATSKDDLILCDLTAGAFTVTLPTDLTGDKIWNIKKIDATANLLTISGSGLNIDGSATVTTSTQWTNNMISWNESTQKFYIR